MVGDRRSLSFFLSSPSDRYRFPSRINPRDRGASVMARPSLRDHTSENERQITSISDFSASRPGEVC